MKKPEVRLSTCMAGNPENGSHLFVGLPLWQPRLLIPMASSRTQALSFGLYNPGSGHGKLSKFLGQVVARSGLMKMAGRLVAVPIETFNATSCIQSILDRRMISGLQDRCQRAIGKRPVSVALSLGEPGWYQKATAIMFDKGSTPLAFAKVGFTPQAGSLIANESVALTKLRFMGFRESAFPTLLGCGSAGSAVWLLQSPLLSGIPSPAVLQDAHFDFLTELAGDTCRVMQPELWSIWRNLRDLTDSPTLHVKTPFCSETAFIVHLRDEFLASSREGAQRPWPFATAHGDFAPWNVRVAGNRLLAFDWEHFLSLAPAGWDALHFIFRVENLIKKKSLESIWAAFEAGAHSDIMTRFERCSGVGIPDRRFLGLLVILAIALDLVPRWICGKAGVEDTARS